jgi:hypothetical protein
MPAADTLAIQTQTRPADLLPLLPRCAKRALTIADRKSCHCEYTETERVLT